MLRDTRLSQTNRPVDVLLHWADGDDGLYLDTPYQRGDVWGRKRRVNFIRSLLMGIPVPSIVINQRMFADWANDFRIAVIDGRQRITTVLMFLRGQLAVPGEWFDLPGQVTFDDLPPAQQRKFKNLALPFSEGRLKTLAEEQEVFDLVNFGGLAQGEVDGDA